MKILYIMRHAKSSWADQTLPDHQRPLNKRGRRNVPVMGQRLKARGVRPDLIISSDARRALDTAIPIAGLLGLDPAAVRRDADLYHATETEILSLVKGLDDRWQRVMIVGHNPGLGDLANRFLATPLPNLPTAGVVELKFEIAAWQSIDPSRIAEGNIDYPKKEA